MNLEPIKVIDIKNFGMKFKDLADHYPELKTYSLSKKRIIFDLGDPQVLSLINKYLFLELGNLKIDLPDDFLIPAYSLRLAYVNTINSLIDSSLPIVEIGTGSSAALAMLFANKYQKQVIATEKNPISYNFAQSNIITNNLQEYISLLKSEGEIIKNLIPPNRYAALICYPPIYEHEPTKLKKRRGWKGKTSELFGGSTNELSFTKQLLDEALTSSNIFFEIISVMVMNRKQIEELARLYSSKYTCSFIKLIAGTRNRFIFLIGRKNLL